MSAPLKAAYISDQGTVVLVRAQDGTFRPYLDAAAILDFLSRSGADQAVQDIEALINTARAELLAMMFGDAK